MKLVSLYFILLFPVLSGVVSCTLNEADQPVKIFGRITGSDGNGIGGVDVLVKRGDVEQSVITSDNGRYELVLPDAGQIEMIFSKTGYTSHEKSLVLLGGEKKRMDLILHTLSEDAYFNIAPAEMTFYNTGGSAIAYINTNVSFEQESVPSWLTVNVEGTTLTIQCDSNETHDERLGYIVYNAAYNLRDTMIVRQLAGPVLKLVNYWGSDSSGFSHEKPFVAFSEEIEVVSATSSGSNLEFELSDDKKTVYFNQIKIGAFSNLPVSLKVKASDNIQLSFDVNFKLYVNSTPFVGPNGQKILFTNDNKYIWILSYQNIMGSQKSLVQFSTEDFSEQRRIAGMSQVFYNPYNNALYLPSQRFFEDRYVCDIYLYDATTGNFKEMFTFDNENGIHTMVFSDNGYGLITSGSSLYSIDSSNNHEIKVITSSLFGGYAPYTVDICNNNKTFVLYSPRHGTELHVFTMDAEVRKINKIFFMSDYLHFKIYNYVTSNAVDQVFYFSGSRTDVMFQHVETQHKISMDLIKGVKNATLLYSGAELPNVLTSDFRIVLPNENKTSEFNLSASIYYLDSSHDAKLVCITNGYNVYLFRSEMFSKYYNFIK